MLINEKQREQQKELHTKLWAIANDLRGNMDANEFKNYILGLIFYRYLSEKVEKFMIEQLESEDLSYEEAWKNEEYREELEISSKEDLGYFIAPQNLFSTLLKSISNESFNIEELEKAINNITESTLGQGSQEDFDNLFDDMDLKSTKLGRDLASRSKLIGKVMSKISEIDFNHEESEIDVLGDAYEYLISQFAASAGKKAGEFYTPQPVSKVLAKIVVGDKKDLKNVYDPTCGSGSLLLRVSKEANVREFYGQELTSTTYNLARMNMLLHGVNYDSFKIRNNDTLEHDEFKGKKFEAIVANPPYSAKWSADASFLEDDRFREYGKLAPKSKADFAFIQHMLYHLEDNGTMAVVLPHGVLFRGAAEGIIREYIIKEKNELDAVIGLPANIFYGTSIPTVILVFKKNRPNKDNIVFIDASNEFVKEKNQNNLTDEHVEKIISTYRERKEVDKYCYVASIEEIKENGYNLNIPRYVDTFEEEEAVDIVAVSKRIEEIDREIVNIDEKLEIYLKELGI